MPNLAETALTITTAQYHSTHLPQIANRGSQAINANSEPMESEYSSNPILARRYFINRTQLDLPATRRELFEE